MKNLGLKMYGNDVMLSYQDLNVNVLEKLSLQNKTFYIPLERKFDDDQFLTKDFGLKMYGTEVMVSYSDVIVRICRNLSPMNIRIYVLLDK